MTRTQPADPPDDAERPVPLVAVPEGTSRPADWSTTSAEALDPADGGDDAVLADRQEAESTDRRGRASGTVRRPEPEGTSQESSYSTDRAQGAAQPGPTTEEA